MSTLSGAELFRSQFNVPRSDLRDTVGDAVGLLLARADNCVFERGGTSDRIGSYAGAILDILDGMDQEVRAGKNTPDCHRDVQQFVDLRTLPERLSVYTGEDIKENTDANRLLEVINDLALCDPADKPTIPPISRQAMPPHDRL